MIGTKTRYIDLLNTFESDFGNPSLPETNFSWKKTMDDDNARNFPSERLANIRDLNISLWNIPRDLGGNQQSLEELAVIARCLARRDPVLALICGMQAWSQIIWLAGSDEQKDLTANCLREHGLICFAASEREHGADLSANETVAKLQPDKRYILDGEKWPIGLAKQADLAIVLAKTANDNGFRNLSLLLVEKRKLSHDELTILPSLHIA